MAKVPGKKEAPQAPQIHRISLPVSDESLVIDLPDGQKLVVGKLATGSVIEVATWRGTGRPDSRTTRLMLGMSSVNAIEQAPEEAQAPATQAKGAQAVALLAKARTLLANVKLPKLAIKKPAAGSPAELTFSALEDETVSKEETTPKSERRSLWTPPTPADSTSGEADKWLEEILNRAAKNESVKKAPAKAPVKKAPAKKAAVTRSKSTPSKSQGRSR